MIKSMFQLTHKKLNGATQFKFDWISVSQEIDSKALYRAICQI